MSLVSKTPEEAFTGESAPSALQDFSLHKPKAAPKYDIDAMSDEDLLKLRDKIEAKLSGLSLSDIDLMKEMLIQLKKAKILQEKAEKEDETPLNQRAQVQNSISNIITRLAAAQTTLYDSERLKRLEAATIKCVKSLPKDAQDLFFSLYDVEIDKLEGKVPEELENAAPEAL